MECHEIRFSTHALQRMFARSVSADDVIRVVRHGEDVATYPADRPYPSQLLLGWIGEVPLHVVVARAPDGVCYVVTAYIPSPDLWLSDFRTRRGR